MKRFLTFLISSLVCSICSLFFIFLFFYIWSINMDDSIPTILSISIVIGCIAAHLIIMADADFNLQRISRTELELTKREANLKLEAEKLKQETEASHKKIDDEYSNRSAQLDKQREVIQNGICKIESEALAAAPWLAQMYADFIYSIDFNHVHYLERKAHPAKKSAEIVHKTLVEYRSTLKQLKLLQYQMNVYEAVAPWLEDFRDVDSETIRACIQTEDMDSADICSEFDTIKRWLSKEEYDRLPTVERYQLALDRYKHLEFTI